MQSPLQTRNEAFQFKMVRFLTKINPSRNGTQTLECDVNNCCTARSSATETSSYLGTAPFPGACCLTCSMEFDPNIAISSNSLETNITFAFANVYYGRSGGKGNTAPPCDGNTITGKKPEHYRLEYHIYVMFLPEGDLSEKSLFEGVEKMAYPARIKNHGQEVSALTAPTLPVLKFLTYPSGQGIVYNVIVKDPQNDNKEAAYSPVATYGCDVCEEKCKLMIFKGKTAYLEKYLIAK